MFSKGDVKQMREPSGKFKRPFWFQFKKRKIYKDTWALDEAFIDWLLPRIDTFIECETKTHEVDDAFLKDLKDIKEACQDFILEENDPWAWKDKHHLQYTELEKAYRDNDKVKLELILNHATYTREEKKLLKKVMNQEEKVRVRRKYKLHKFIKVLDKLWW